jgi:phosphoribosylanthranilate isomerase
VRVKVCGLQSYEDAVSCLDEGVDALGFNFYPLSPRYVSPADARAILRRLPPLVTSVGLFVNIPAAMEVDEMARASGVQVLQLHGDEPPEYCSQLGHRLLVKAIRVQGDLEHVAALCRRYAASAWLLDSRDPLLFGGTGRSFDWSIAAGVAAELPVILAGGLHAENVREAILAVRPYAVDVCTGVECAPGKKDGRKIRYFMDEVRNVSDAIRRGTAVDAR